MPRITEDLIGNVYGKLTVTRRAEKDKNNNVQWYCKCECGTTEKIIRGFQLKNGSTKSCGCILRSSKKEGYICDICKSNKNITKVRSTKQLLCKKHYYLYKQYGTATPINMQRGIPNEIEIIGDIAKIYLYDRNGYKVSYATVSSKKVDLIKKYRWSKDKNGYISNKEVGYLHRFVMGTTDESVVVDHILGADKSNNTDENLQITTTQKNIMKSKKSKNNTSGFIGVSYNHRCKKWESHITYNYVKIYLGLFQNKEEAIRVRLIAEYKYFGIFSPQRNLFSKYEIGETHEQSVDHKTIVT